MTVDGAGLRMDFTRTGRYKSRLEPSARLMLRALSPLADFSCDSEHLNPVRVG